MEWIALVRIILRLLAPIIVAWLANLLKRAAGNLDSGMGYGNPADYEHSGGAGSAERRLWMEAQAMLESDLANLSWWQRLWGVAARRRRYFNAARAAAERRAGNFYAAALGGNEVQPLTSDEIKEIQQEG